MFIFINITASATTVITIIPVLTIITNVSTISIIPILTTITILDTEGGSVNSTAQTLGLPTARSALCSV